MNLTIGNISKHVAVFDNHMLMNAVIKIKQRRSDVFVFPKKIMVFIATLWWRQLFSKPLAIIKPPNNKNTTGLAYDEKIDLVLNSIKNGEINIGIKAVIDRGIASVIQKKSLW